MVDGAFLYCCCFWTCLNVSRRALNAASLKGSGRWCGILEGDVAYFVGAPLEISGGAVEPPLEIANGGGVCSGTRGGCW